MTDKLYHHVDVEDSPPVCNNIHIESTLQNKNILEKKFSICWTMISLNQAKVNEVLLAF